MNRCRRPELTKIGNDFSDCLLNICGKFLPFPKEMKKIMLIRKFYGSRDP